MSIHYRCRCGQEVTLRSREPVYLLLSLLLGVAIFNGIATGVLWYRLTGESAAPGAERPAEVVKLAPGPVAPPPTSVEPPSSAVVPPVEASPPAAARPAEPTKPEITPTPAEDARIPPTPAPPAPRAKLRFSPAPSMTGIRLWSLLAALPERPEERLAVTLAAAHWGDGKVRTRACTLLAGDGFAPPLAASAGTVPGDVEIDADALPSERRALLAEVEAKWRTIWERLLLTEHGPPEVREWVIAAQGGLERPVDLLLLVDLSQSMHDDLPRLREVLDQLVPLSQNATKSVQWGWIGYRDEVVETHDLRAPGEEFLQSIRGWSGAGGGDVPEGLDHALFEALRLGSLGWRPGAEHRILIAGDAPPPYERIRPMLSLIEGASASPEKYRFSCIGILRDDEFPTLPAFEEIAKRGGGELQLLAEGAPMFAPVWKWIFGSSPPRGRDPAF